MVNVWNSFWNKQQQPKKKSWKYRNKKSREYCVVCFWRKHYLIQRPFVDFILLCFIIFVNFFVNCFELRVSWTNKQKFCRLSHFHFVCKMLKWWKAGVFFFYSFIYLSVAKKCFYFSFLWIVQLWLWINFHTNEIKVKLLRQKLFSVWK